MNAVRFGSYSSRSTVAGTSVFDRLKSTIRYRRLLPPPRQRIVMRPVLLRPPLPRSPSVNALTGLPFHSSLRSTMTNCRRDGVVGLNVFSAIGSDSCRHVDPLTLAQGHDRLFVVGTLAGTAAHPLQFAHDPDRVHRGHIDVEQALNGRLHLELRRGQRYAKDHLVVLGDISRFFGDHRAADDVVHLLPREPRDGARNDAKPAHLRRASRCCTASRVSTSTSRRRIS